ncbi:MAG: carboxypeptidase regulatory-like domain-containing protein [Myxococcota bacterium]
MVWKRMIGLGFLPILAALVALLAAAPAWAQTTGKLRVTVIDTIGGSNSPLEDAECSLVGDTLIGGAVVKFSDSNGEVQFADLPPGSYELAVTYPGYQSARIGGIKIQVNRVVQQTVPMREGEVEEMIIDFKEKAVDVEKTTRSTVLSKEFLQKIPAGRSYQNAINIVAGVQPGVGGNASVGGGAFNETTYLIDGVNVTDPVTGTFGVNFNFDAIQQVEVLLGGYQPEYGTSVGGIVNILTESGTNNLEFNAGIVYQNGNLRPRLDERLSADGFVLAPTGFDVSVQSYQIPAVLSGPIVRDKAWFFLSYQATRTLSNNVAIPQQRDFDGHYFLGKITVQPTPAHRLSVQLQTSPTNIDNTQQFDQFTRSEAQERQSQGGYILTGTWQWFLNSDVTLETRATAQKIYIERSSVACTHNPNSDSHRCEPGEREANVDWFTPGRLGRQGAYNSVNSTFFTFDDRLIYTLDSRLSVLSVTDWFGGAHDFKFGVNAQQLVWDRISGFNGNIRYFDIYAVPFNADTFQNFFTVESSGPQQFRVSSSRYAMFAQDSYKPVPNLTLNYGLRFDAFVLRNDLGEPTVSAALLGPRLFGAWDPFGDQRTKIATGYGRFNDTGRLGIAGFTSVSGFGIKQYLTEFFAIAGGDPADYVNAQQQIYFATEQQNFNFANEDLRAPRVDEIILQVEREIVEDYALFSDFSGKYSRFMFEPDGTNFIYDSDGSAIIGSRYGDVVNERPRLRTPALAKRDFYQWDIGIRKVESRRWAGSFTYTYVNGVGSSTQALSGSFLNDQQTQFNYGLLNTDRRHQINSFVYWNLPTDPNTTTLSATFQYDSGFPFDRLYPTEGFGGQNGTLRIRDRGTYARFNSFWELSLGFRQAINLRKGQVELGADVQNITNNRSPINGNGLVVNRFNRLLVTARQAPLRIQFRARYQF